MIRILHVVSVMDVGGVILDGWQSDSAFSVLVGGGTPEAQKLVDVTEECFC